ncbi:hypothetical protein [Streptomyces sp. NPDC059009]|uniref:hypothetical protein n=1 Tax=Streptomyces sp. NPDC059009 TaxID=3346694 RepID=UPI0036909A45
MSLLSWKRVLGAVAVLLAAAALVLLVCALVGAAPWRLVTGVVIGAVVAGGLWVSAGRDAGRRTRADRRP